MNSLWGSILASLLPSIAVIVSAILTRSKLKEIHLLVNGNLHNALTEIKDLKAEIVAHVKKEMQ